jgi:hypothetical protein
MGSFSALLAQFAAIGIFQVVVRQVNPVANGEIADSD